MAGDTSISWTDSTWNPMRGCTRKSAGCTNCYAERMAARFSDEGQPFHGYADRDRAGSKWTGLVSLVDDQLAIPLHWKKPRRVFVNSMSDMFHERLSHREIAAVFGIMLAAPQHTYQVLTKRAEHMRKWFEWLDDQTESAAASWSDAECSVSIHDARDACRALFLFDVAKEHLSSAKDRLIVERAAALIDHPKDAPAWPAKHVWLGTSVEDQRAAAERVPELLRTPAAVRFLSCEPLIGQVDLAKASPNARSFVEDLDWIIAGCESGHGARDCEVNWLRALRDQCAAARVPFFLKQAEALAAVGGPLVRIGKGSKAKGRGTREQIIELPYLDGVQHAAFPVAKDQHATD